MIARILSNTANMGTTTEVAIRTGCSENLQLMEWI
jgi:hypothetical protein